MDWDLISVKIRFLRRTKYFQCSESQQIIQAEKFVN